MSKITHLLLLLGIFIALGADICHAQSSAFPDIKYDSLTSVEMRDSIASVLAENDSLIISADSLMQEEIGDIETSIQYSAVDSIQMDVANQIVKLFGDAKIVYGEVKLSASQIEINYATNIISASSTQDSLGNE